MEKHIHDATRLAEELQNYPYLYEKRKKGYKRKRPEEKCLESSF